MNDKAPLPSLSCGFWFSNRVIKSWVSTGRASSPSGQIISSAGGTQCYQIFYSGFILNQLVKLPDPLMVSESCSSELTTHNLSKKLFRCVSEERHTSHQKLVQDDAHGPPVDRLPVALPQDHFWSNVLRGATNL